MPLPELGGSAQPSPSSHPSPGQRGGPSPPRARSSRGAYNLGEMARHGPACGTRVFPPCLLCPRGWQWDLERLRSPRAKLAVTDPLPAPRDGAWLRAPTFLDALLLLRLGKGRGTHWHRSCPTGDVGQPAGERGAGCGQPLLRRTAWDGLGGVQGGSATVALVMYFSSGVVSVPPPRFAFRANAGSRSVRRSGRCWTLVPRH